MKTDTSVIFQLTLWTEAQTQIVLSLVFLLMQNVHTRLGPLLSFQI